MTKTVATRERQCRSFLRALSSGTSVTDACKASGIQWNTLYRWRRTDPGFRSAWDDAARAGDDAKATEFEAELRRRALLGIDEPVFHAGEQVATRKRYSDPLLMFALRELRHRRRPDADQAPPSSPAAGEPRVTVIVERLSSRKKEKNGE